MAKSMLTKEQRQRVRELVSQMEAVKARPILAREGIDVGLGSLRMIRHRELCPPPKDKNPWLPWRMEREHWMYAVPRLLRLVNRRESGLPLSLNSDLVPVLENRLDAWLAGLEADDVCIDYRPDLDYQKPFPRVPRRHVTRLGMDEIIDKVIYRHDLDDMGRRVMPTEGK